MFTVKNASISSCSQGVLILAVWMLAYSYLKFTFVLTNNMIGFLHAIPLALIIVIVNVVWTLVDLILAYLNVNG